MPRPRKDPMEVKERITITLEKKYMDELKKKDKPREWIERLIKKELGCIEDIDKQKVDY